MPSPLTRRSTADLTSHVPLLKDTVNILLDGATYFVGDTERAQRARQKLRKKKDPDDREFFAILFEDLQKADATLQGVPDAWTDGEGPGQQAILGVLDIVQTDYLDDDVSDDEDDEEQDSPHTYARLKHFITEYQSLSGKEDGAPKHEEHRIVLLCDRIKFEKTKTKSRSALLQAINTCHQSLKSASIAAAVDTSWRFQDPTATLWSTKLFTNAESFHKMLASNWKCECFDDGSQLHQKACFSFDNVPDGEDEQSSGVMLFQTIEEGADSMVYKHARYHFQSRSTLTLEKPRVRRSSIAVAHFCETLDGCDDRYLIKITGNAIEMQNRPADDQTGGINALDTVYPKPPLTACFDLGPGHDVYKLSEKRRMMIALYLVYAFLDLGGGAFWPYDRRTSVYFANHSTGQGNVTIYFAASLVAETANHDRFSIFYRSSSMPGLVALGQLLLSLFLGRHVFLETIENELKGCEEKFHAKQIVKAVETCLSPGESDHTIRSDERLRGRFIQNVILPIQEILHHGFGVQAKDIFAPPPPIKILDTATPKRLRSATGFAKDRVEEVPDGYCLHDGHAPEKLDESQAQDADKYMKRLQKCISETLARLPSAPRGCRGAVRVAIIDTGADIHPEELEYVYGSRVYGNRSWLTTTKEDGEDLLGPEGVPLSSQSLDANGHGTHCASALLQATTETDIEVYIAQVFDTAKAKVVDDVILDDPTVTRVANAIKYAVDVWKADILSFSFGFPREIPEIDTAIDHAYKKDVLMLAAAANCGSNDVRSWPARDERVLCIYATDGCGNKYPRNPDPVKGEDNFATLGCAVEALWPASSRDKTAVRKRKSGTSTATPIAAAIAALVISSMRQCENDYVQAAMVLRPGSNADEIRKEHRRRTGKLGRASRMRKVFRLMLGEVGERDGYQNIIPWTLFKQENSAKALADAILYDT